MRLDIDYTKKFDSFNNLPIYKKLDATQQQFVKKIAFAHRLTFQEFRQIVEIVRDLELWGEEGLDVWWQQQVSQSQLQGIRLKEYLLSRLDAHIESLKAAPKGYPAEGFSRPKKREKSRIVTEKSDKKIHGMCPVASPKTVCCNLRTIDAVENCIFGCSYCSIQTFYREKIVFDENFAEKLQQISVEPDRFYHFGTGQASDSLAWGNRNGNLDALCRFAEEHPNALLEFKTKSDNIGYFLENDTPPNIVCSWSLNTPEIIRNEEHFTANLAQRIQAARDVADKGVKVSFHFHPMVYHQGWEQKYPAIAAELMQRFLPEDVLFISFGSVTLIKPVIKKIRQLGHQTKMLQMPMVADPHGKLTYPDEIKIRMFKTMYDAFTPWHDAVFFYLCMEKAAIWEAVFGSAYESNEIFERDFGRKTMCKISRLNEALID